MSNKVIVISGLPGTGKSTLAEQLSQKIKTPILSVDPIESAIIKSGIKKSFETGLAAYLVVEVLADDQLKLGQSVVIDAVNAVQEAREMWFALAKKHHVEIYIIECQLPENVHKYRVENRIRGLQGIPEVTWKDVEDRKKEYLEWQEERLIINTVNSANTNLEKVLDYIKD